MEVAGLFYGHVVYFTAIWYRYIVAFWYMLWLFGIVFPFWYVEPRKIWQPWCRQRYINTDNINRNGCKVLKLDYVLTRLYLYIYC
jgi:hypothetical protein